MYKIIHLNFGNVATCVRLAAVSIELFQLKNILNKVFHRERKSERDVKNINILLHLHFYVIGK